MPRSLVSAAILSLVPLFLAVSLVLGEDASVSALFERIMVETVLREVVEYPPVHQRA